MLSRKILNSIRYHYKVAVQNQQYKNAVIELNNLQINGMLSMAEKKQGMGLIAMKEFLERVNLTDNDIKDLKIVHITGTKGKGSTCAFVESILRHNNIKTGLYTSPHLFEVRERFRINGKSISQEMFVKYFRKVYDLLESTKHNYTIKMPSYFYFLTTMALYIFKHESVEAAILEVGFGGSFDATNVIKNPIVCGVSSLGIDHIHVLGDSLESIAWHKSGIFKKNVPAFTIRQPEKGFKVMSDRAKEIGTNLNCVPDLSKLWAKENIKLSLEGSFQRLNAVLAVQLAYCWLNNGALATPTTLPQSYVNGLLNCQWNGRAQTLKFDNITFYLDCAHTKESITYAVEWFNEESGKEEKELNKACSKILCFNATKNRNANYGLLSSFVLHNFACAIFTPNVATLVSSNCNDQAYLINSPYSKIDFVKSHQNDWITLCSKNTNKLKSESFAFNSIAEAVCFLSKDKDLKLHEYAKSNVLEAKSFKPGTNDFSCNHLQVLVTGSLYLVAGYLQILKPDLND